jgi:uncharacterized membrane protein YbhN (UPF0104 family)
MTPEAAPEATRFGHLRALVLAVLRLVLVPAALIWIITQAVGAGWASHTSWDPSLLLLGLAVNQIALAVFATRMQLVLRLFDVRIAWLPALRIHLQSMFYFFALPMTVGLEIARFIKIRQLQPGATMLQMSSALLIDRLLGAGSALVVGLLCLPFVNLNAPVTVPAWGWLAAAGGALAVAGGAALLVPRSRQLIGDAWRLLSGRGPGIVGLFAVSLIMHVIFAAGVHVLAAGLGLPLAFVDTLFAVAGGLLLVAIPVSLAGLGPAEVGAAGLLLMMGYAPTVALVAGALPYLARLLGALEGAAWEFAESGSSAIVATRGLLAGRQSS